MMIRSNLINVSVNEVGWKAGGSDVAVVAVGNYSI